MSQTNYFWQNNNVSPESYANRLEGRRLELLDFFHGSAKGFILKIYFFAFLLCISRNTCQDLF